MKQKKWKMVSKVGDNDFGVKYSSNESVYKNSHWEYITFTGKVISEQEYRDNLTKYIDIRGTWIYKDTGKEEDMDGYNKFGYDKKGFDKDGFNHKGYDKDGYDRNGYDKFDFNRLGINRDTKRKKDSEGHDRKYYG